MTYIGAEPGHCPSTATTDSATYGYYLEKPGAGKSHRRYPFLVPALDRFEDRACRRFPRPTLVLT